jgi:acyl carrier protein
MNKMKTLDEFVQLFAERFDDTEESMFAPNTEFRTLDEWSSLISLSVIAMVDEEFDVALKGADFRSANTIEDLYKIVISKL